jgi:hypothetical protein
VQVRSKPVSGHKPAQIESIYAQPVQGKREPSHSYRSMVGWLLGVLLLGIWCGRRFFLVWRLQEEQTDYAHAHAYASANHPAAQTGFIHSFYQPTMIENERDEFLLSSPHATNRPSCPPQLHPHPHPHPHPPLPLVRQHRTHDSPSLSEEATTNTKSPFLPCQRTSCRLSTPSPRLSV